MITTLENIQLDLERSGIRSDLISVLWWKELLIDLGHYSITITKDSSWYYLEHKVNGRIVVEVKVRILGNTNRDNIELVKMIKHLSEYTVS